MTVGSLPIRSPGFSAPPRPSPVRPDAGGVSDGSRRSNDHRFSKRSTHRPRRGRALPTPTRRFDRGEGRKRANRLLPQRRRGAEKARTCGQPDPSFTGGTIGIHPTACPRDGAPSHPRSSGCSAVQSLPFPANRAGDLPRPRPTNRAKRPGVRVASATALVAGLPPTESAPLPQPHPESLPTGLFSAPPLLLSSAAVVHPDAGGVPERSPRASDRRSEA